MKFCSAIFCQKPKSDTDITLHIIPRNDLKLRKKWIKFCKNPADWNPKIAYICSKHFKSTDFEGKKLSPNAVPSIVTKVAKNKSKIEHVPVILPKQKQKVNERIKKGIVPKTEEVIEIETPPVKKRKGRPSKKAPVVQEKPLIEESTKIKNAQQIKEVTKTCFVNLSPRIIKEVPKINKEPPKIKEIAKLKEEEKPKAEIERFIDPIEFDSLIVKLQAYEKEIRQTNIEISSLKAQVSKQNLEIYKKNLYIISLENKVEEATQAAKALAEIKANHSKKSKKKSKVIEENHDPPDEIDSILGI